MVGGRGFSVQRGRVQHALLTTHRGLVLILRTCVSLASAWNHVDGEGSILAAKVGSGSIANKLRRLC